ncbi:MAG: DEAD/DEAH box helicase, partial [Chloroflexota bacterium]|nr:DEAD/DEAH box helicase [Chloroflexota bacterium]
STGAKAGPGWAGAVATRYRVPSNEREGREKYLQLMQTYRELRQQLRHPSTNIQAHLADFRRHVAEARQKVLQAARAYPVCPHCGYVHYEQPRQDEDPIPVTFFRAFERKALRCTRPYSGWAMDKETGERYLDQQGKPVWLWVDQQQAPTVNGYHQFQIENDAEGEGLHAVPAPEHLTAPRCGTTLIEFGARYKKWSIADYIKDHYQNFFQFLVVDELHEYKGESTERGIAMHRLATAIPEVIGMTGTLYNGYSKSLFYALGRLYPRVFEEYGYQGAQQWVHDYGVLEKKIYHEIKSDDGYSASNATAKRRTYTKELPGVSPAILKYLIGNTIFLTLQDMGTELPPYSEEIVPIPMSAAQEKQYKSMDSYLLRLAREDHRYLSTWLQWAMSRPNSGFRDEVVRKVFRDEDGKVISRRRLKDLPAVVSGDELLPKEQWLRNFVAAEYAAGRKVLLFLEQTGTRDITGRLASILGDAGLRAKVLTSSVSTTKREAWVNRQARQVDILICNPELVKTGLDLIQFSTVVFYELTYVLTTMWQAMRRVYRLTQDKPVKVIFPVYTDHNPKGSHEERAVSLQGRKMQAAQLLYGDQVTGALVPTNAGSFASQMLASALADEDVNSATLEGVFADRLQVTTTSSVMGSATAHAEREPVTVPTEFGELLLTLAAQTAAEQLSFF